MYTVKYSTNNSELEAIIQLRYAVLRAPWNQSIDSASDELEIESYNAYISNEQGIVIACGRLQQNPFNIGQIRYMAVHPTERGKHLGLTLLTALEQKAKSLGLSKIELQARENALDFYLKAGYKNNGESFKLWDTIQHYHMEKNIG